jgi:hypothetical protein
VSRALTPGEGDSELVDFFEDVQEQDAKRAQKAKELLGER